MRSSLLDRFVCSIQAIVIGWLISGIVFFVTSKGPSGISAWCIWGTAFFVIGWVFVGLPLIVLGDRVHRVPSTMLIAAGGLSGALVMALPGIVFGFFTRSGVHWKYELSDLKWEGIAFIIAAPTTALYLLLVDRVEAGDRSRR